MTLEQAQTKLNEAKTMMDLAEIAGRLNNRPEHINTDKVTCLGFLDHAQGKNHVQHMIDQSTKRGAK
jgi:hypothetical protein